MQLWRLDLWRLKSDKCFISFKSILDFFHDIVSIKKIVCTSLRSICFPTRSRNIFTYKKCQETEGKKDIFHFSESSTSTLYWMLSPLGAAADWSSKAQEEQKCRSRGAEEQRSRGETLETTDGAPAISTPGGTTPTLVAAVATLSMRGMKGWNRSDKYLLSPASFNTFL